MDGEQKLGDKQYKDSGTCHISEIFMSLNLGHPEMSHSNTKDEICFVPLITKKQAQGLVDRPLWVLELAYSSEEYFSDLIFKPYRKGPNLSRTSNDQHVYGELSLSDLH